MLTYDYCVPSELVEQYVNWLKAPHKEIIWFENSAHMITIEETAQYQDILVNKILSDAEATASALE